MAITIEQLRETIKSENKKLENNIQKQLTEQKNELTKLFEDSISMINNRIDLIDTKVDDIAKTASDAYDTTHGIDKDLKLVKGTNHLQNSTKTQQIIFLIFFQIHVFL